MQKLDLQVKSLDDIFDSMAVYAELPNDHPRKHAANPDPANPVFVHGFFSTDDEGRTRWRSVWGRLKPELRGLIQGRCCEGPPVAAKITRQHYASVPGQCALIATDRTMIPNIRVCLLPNEAMTFNGVNLLRDNLPVGPVGGAS